MSTCSHGRDLSTQVCKYCSCPHGTRKENCATCSGIVTATTTSSSKGGLCMHGVDASTFCGKCMAAGNYGMSGSFNARMPGDFGLSAEARIKRQRELEYKARVAEMEKVPGAVRMYRTWSLDAEDNLRAMVATYKWHQGQNTATSMADGGHAGFFGFSSLTELQKQEKQWWELSQTGQPYVDGGSSMYARSFLDFHLPTKRWYVSGTFLAYGHMVIAEHGGRSQFAVPEYIIEPDGSDPDFSMRILAVAEKHGMELISVATARELKVGAVPWWKGKPNA